MNSFCVDAGRIAFYGLSYGGKVATTYFFSTSGGHTENDLRPEFRAFADTSPSGWIAEEFPNIQAGGHRYAREWEA